MSDTVSDGLGAAAGSAAAGAAGFAGAAMVGAAAADCAWVAAASVRSVRMTEPSLARSPTFALRSCTTPPSGEGTSIEALPDSRVTSGCSGLIVFFFQAEDGIRDLTVTGVQTCALPI